MAQPSPPPPPPSTPQPHPIDPTHETPPPPPPPPPPPQPYPAPPSSSAIPPRPSNPSTTTPPPTTSNKPSRFQFLSNNKQTPTPQLQKIEQEALKRREEFRSRVTNIENRIATFTTNLAQEVLERERDHCRILKQGIYSCDDDNDDDKEEEEEEGGKMDRKQMSESKWKSWNNVDEKLRRIEMNEKKLQYEMIQWRYVDIADMKQKCFEELGREIREGVKADVRLEASKADKREGGLVRRFETIAGQSAKMIIRERAAREAAIELLEKDVEFIRSGDEKKVQDFLKEVKQIKDDLARERKERQRQDERVLDQIIKQQEMLQKAVLDTLGGGGGRAR